MHIWSQTREAQRKGYHAAGIGLTAGQFLDANLSTLINFLELAEEAVASGDAEASAPAVVQFAELVFRTAPFRSPKNMPANWTDALGAWMRGRPSAEVIAICGDDGVELLQEALTYRLPWAMEAVRVHGTAVAQRGSDELSGLAALAVEAGSANRSVITLLRSGLSSRDAAIAAVMVTGASFEDRVGMQVWLRSDEIEARHAENNWPTEQSRHAWLRFYEGETRGDRRRWARTRQRILVEWSQEAPSPGTHVVIELSAGGVSGFVLSTGFEQIGILKSVLSRPRRDIVAARVGARSGTVLVEYFGPP
jgi:hypothetical protein